MELTFADRKLKTIKQIPIEKEQLRLSVYSVQHTNDPFDILS